MAENKKTDNKITETREYVIPLRERCRIVPRYKKTNKAVRTVKEFLVRHMRIRDRDLNKIKVDTYLNEFLWRRGIKHPPHKVKVRAVKEGEIVRVELAEMPKKLEQKKAREQKREEVGKKVAEKKKAEAKAPEKPAETEEKKVEEKEKQAATIEAGKEMEKAAAKQMKQASKKSEIVPTAQRRSLQR